MLSVISNADTGINWTSAKFNQFISDLHEKKEWRPTVVVLLQNHQGKFGIGRQNNGEENWSPVQGGIHLGESLAQAGLREIREEAGYPAYAISFVTPLLHLGRLEFAPGQSVDGFTRGKFYFCFGMRLYSSWIALGKGSDELLEWRWEHADEACRLCVEQPWVRRATEATRRKGWHILEPAIQLMARFPVVQKM